MTKLADRTLLHLMLTPENLTDILLGQFVSDRAKELVGRKQADAGLLEWSKSQSRPMLIADEPGVLPH